MSFTSTTTYLYAYMAFALVYLAGSAVSAGSAMRMSVLLAQTRTPHDDSSAPAQLGSVLGYGRRLVDYTQAATVLPLVYIVGSLLLGSLIIRSAGTARTINIVWVAFTLICAGASILLAVLALRTYRRMRPASSKMADGAPDAVQRVGVRLGVSAALLLVVAAFTLLNVWSVVGDLGVLKATDFLL